MLFLTLYLPSFVLAFGAGAISKRIFSHEARIERTANIKDLRMYLERLDEMITRKNELFAGGSSAAASE